MKQPLLQQVDRTYVRCDGQKLSYFAGCDYFRMSSHPAVLKALQQGLDKYGLSVSASRMTTGEHELYAKLEKEIAGFFNMPAALLAAEGYQANSLVAQGLSGEVTHACVDDKAHPAIKDATCFLKCPVAVFKHRDPSDLARVLEKLGKKAKPLVMTDGMFSGTGEFAPLKAYLEVLPKNGLLLIDDAHGAGVLGKTGRGALEQEGVQDARIIYTLALSKAFGTFGGAVVCSKSLREQFVLRSRIFSGSTPLALPLVNAALASLSLLRRDGSYLKRLRGNAEYLKAALTKRGMGFPTTPAPIIALPPPKNAREVALMRKRLLARKVYPSLIAYPGGPAIPYFRFVISSEHTKPQLDALLGALLET